MPIKLDGEPGPWDDRAMVQHIIHSSNIQHAPIQEGGATPVVGTSFAVRTIKKALAILFRRKSRRPGYRGFVYHKQEATSICPDCDNTFRSEHHLSLHLELEQERRDKGSPTFEDLSRMRKEWQHQ